MIVVDSTFNPLPSFFTRENCVVKKSEDSFDIIALNGLILNCDYDGLELILKHPEEALEKYPELKDTLISRKEFPSSFDASVNKNKIREGERYDEKKVLKNAGKEKQLPAAISLMHLELSVTKICPYRCVYCYREKEVEENEQLTINDLSAAVKDAAELGAKSIVLTGGEPLCPASLQRTIKMAKLAKKEGFELVTVPTNGFFDEDTVEKIKDSVDSLAIKLDTYTPQKYEKMVGLKGSLARVLDTIEYASKRVPYVSANMTVMKDNLHDVEGTAKLAFSRGAARLKVTPLYPAGRARKMALSMKELEILHKQLEKEKKEYGRRVFSPLLQYNLRCSAGISDACIFEDGIISTCRYMHNTLPLGRIPDDGLGDVWKRNDFLMKLRYSGNMIDLCERKNVISWAKKMCWL